MILGITDAKGLTNHVSKLRDDGRNAEVQDLYNLLFQLHQNVLIKEPRFKCCKWKVAKTTGDGLMFSSSARPRKEHVETLPELQRVVAEGFADGSITIRAIACYLKPDGIVHGDDLQTLTHNPQLRWLRDDLFGHELNKAFRLLAAISTDAAIIEHSLMTAVFPENVEDKHGFVDPDTGLMFAAPVPITVLKGIDDVGFSPGKKPHWLWEIV